jgi:GNAT superfamily N-acetyltransferase
VIIRPAHEGDVEPVVALLHAQMNRKIAPERWRRLMTYGWLADKPNLGYVAEAAGRIVGYVGAVYSDREISGHTERLVNICAWYLDRDHRGQGGGERLMAEATANPDWHYNIMTSSSRTLKILANVGYRVLDDARFDWQRTEGAALTVEGRTDVIAASVSPAERKILADHAELPVTPVLVTHRGGKSLAIFSVTQKGEDQPWFDLLYVGDTALMREGQALANALLPADDAVLSADARFCGDNAPVGAQAVTLPVPRFVKSSSLSGAAVDHLYTELQLMGLKLD